MMVMMVKNNSLMKTSMMMNMVFFTSILIEKELGDIEIDSEEEEIL